MGDNFGKGNIFKVRYTVLWPFHDGIIAETDWKSVDEIKALKHAYPDDKDFLLQQF